VNVHAKRYSASGGALGSEFLVNTSTTGYQVSPRIAMQPNGDFVVVWHGIGASAHDGYEILGQRYCHALAGDADGNARIDVADVFYLINYLFAGGLAPSCPLPLI
jgi:hypothetical protein